MEALIAALIVLCVILGWKISSVEKKLTQTLNEQAEIIADAQRKADNRVRLAREEADECLVKEQQAREKAKEDALIFAEVIANFVRSEQEGFVPLSSMADELAREYGFAKPGKALTAARKTSRDLAKRNLAALCKDPNEKFCVAASSFAIDVFNHYFDAIIEKATYDNYSSTLQQTRAIYETINAQCRALLNTSITAEYHHARLKELKALNVVLGLRERDRAEQREIREQMRDEEKARREAAKLLREVAKRKAEDERKEDELQARLDLAIGAEKEKYEAILADFRLERKEREDRELQAKSLAEFTKRGHVYVISNIGSFGEDVLKIGMTRRLYPKDRVDELGNASVPFPFDIHAMVKSEDAPKLEGDFHTEFNERRVNKENVRKEFFKVSLDEVRQFLVKEGIDPEAAKFTMRAEAAQYRKTIAFDALPSKQRERELRRLLEEDKAGIANGDDNEFDGEDSIEEETTVA